MAEFGWAYVAGGAITGAAGPTGSIQIKKGPTELDGHSEFVWNSVSNTLEITGDLSASANVSASYFYGDGSNLTNIGGEIAILEEGVSITSDVTSINFVGAVVTASAAGDVVTVNINASSGGGGTGTIGAAEDGDYTDGLYTDFTTSTPIGTAIDRFNEILKILSPPLTPNVQSIDYDQSNGISAKLSFDSSNAITDYSASSTDGGFDTVSRNGIYEAETSGSNYRLGIYNNQTFTGVINYDVVRNEINSNVVYVEDSFGQANNGTLKLELNDVVVHSVDLSSFTGTGNPGSGTGDSLNGESSGFINVSVTGSSVDGNGSTWEQYQYRTAKYQINASDQNKGWNYLRIVHTIGSSNYYSNYIEWINDPDGASAALSISNERIEDIVTNGSIYLSGIEYNTGISANYKAEINNIYRNVFPTGTPISFSSTRATSPSSQTVPDLGIGEDETKSLGITASFDLQGTIDPTQTIGLEVNVSHPLKLNLSNAGSATATGFLIFDNTPPTSTNTTETFIDEVRRITSGSYNTQNSVLQGSATWNSETSIESGGGATAGFDDGLLQIGTSEYNGRLYSPVSTDLPNSGDFGSLTNGNANPNYSNESGQRTYFRKIENTHDSDLYNLKITTTKGGTLFNNSSLGTGNANVYVKIPNETGWMDISQAFSYGNIEDDDGALASGASNDTDSNNNVHNVTFGTASVSSGDYIVLKIVADSTWTGYLSQMSFTLPANQSQATPQVLSDINGETSGISANLSFGTLNSITDYTNVNGSSISLDDFNSNDLYNITDNRRGIFSASVEMNGTINDSIGAGSGYPADAFFNGFSGSLVMEINGTEVHSVSLDNNQSLISSQNTSGSSFNLSAVSFSTLSGIPHYTKPYRTGTFSIDETEQRDGWNYARIIHRTNTDQTTNYIEWVVDSSGSVDDLSVTNTQMTEFNHTDIYYQSGIRYFASAPTASYTCIGNNFYRNVYSDDNDAVRMYRSDNLTVTNIRVSGSGITTTSTAPVSNNGIPMAVLNNTPGCEQQSFQMTGSLTYAGLATSISGGLGLFSSSDVLARSELAHPFKNSGYARGASQTKTAFMVYSGSNGSTNINTNEHFTAEDYRIVSGAYTDQASVISSGNTWDSTEPVDYNNPPGKNAHTDGLVTVNGYAISPLQIGNSGDTRNDSEGTTGLQAPSGNPNYSNLSEDLRTFYRYFRNTSGVLVTAPSITLFGDATIIAANGTLTTGNNNIKVELKVPSDPVYTGSNDKSTGWCDVGSALDNLQDLTVDGAGLYTGTLDTDVDGDGAQVNLGFQGKGIYNNQYFVVKITTHKDWTGYLSEIRMAY